MSDKYVQQIGEAILNDGEGLCVVTSEPEDAAGGFSFEMMNQNTKAVYRVYVNIREITNEIMQEETSNGS